MNDGMLATVIARSLRSTIAWILCVACVVNTSHAAAPTDAIELREIGLTDYRGRNWGLEDFSDKSLVVVAFLGTECPLAKQYALKLEEIYQSHSTRDVSVLGVMSNSQDSLEEIASFANRQSITFPVVKDPGNAFADRLGAQRTPEVFVFDAPRKLRYRGRVDDQFGIGYVRDEPTRRDLRIALDELLSGRDVSVARTEAVGCIIGRSKKASQASDDAPTYHADVAPILAKRCVECHQEGEIAPFALVDYDEVSGWADMMVEVIVNRQMPPWHASPEHGTFSNDRSMTKEEIDTIVRWAKAGAIEGTPDPSKIAVTDDAQPTRAWQLPREPDYVIPVSSEPFSVPAEGSVNYQYFRHDLDLKEDVWIEAAELRPGNHRVVHHILAFARPKNGRGGIDAARSFLVGYVPGSRVEPFPKGHAKRVPAGSELIFQVHYTPIGTPQTDQSQLAVVLADPATITHEVVTTSALETKLKIPPGDADHVVVAQGHAFPADARLLGMSPHMHVRGKSFRYELASGSGPREVLLDIPRYDFNWQTTYALTPGLDMPAGSRLVCTAVFDNSDANLNNPDPTATVRWGDQTWDEMMIGYYHYAVPLDQSSQGGASLKTRVADAIKQQARVRRFDSLDRDGDGQLTIDQVPTNLHAVFRELDRDQDGTLTRDEVLAAE